MSDEALRILRSAAYHLYNTPNKTKAEVRATFDALGILEKTLVAPDEYPDDSEQFAYQSLLQYDYDLQCYVIDGVVAKCGHIKTIQGCYSCAHAGEKV